MANAAGTISRVNYADGQVLTAADLTDEQVYLNAMRQKHATANHHWGIAQGLHLSLRGATLLVSPGMAVDGYGRTLIVPSVVEVQIGDTQPEEASIWLVYAEEPAGVATSGHNTRWREVTRLRIDPGKTLSPWRKPANGTDWPVYLGALKRSNHGGDYQVTTGGRRYIGLVGETLRAVSGKAQMRCGLDFAIGLPRSGKDADKFADNLRVDPAGNLTVTAPGRFDGDIHLQPDSKSAPSGRVGIGFVESGMSPEGPSPWHIYRANIPRKGLPPITRMIIELAGPEDKQNAKQLSAAIGSAGNGVFQPGLTVNSGGDVTVTGVLRVEGKLMEGPILADPTDPRFVKAVANASGSVSGDPAPDPLVVKTAGPGKSSLGALDYSFTFVNNAGTFIQISQVQEFVTLNNEPVSLPPKAVPAFRLEAGKSRTIDRSLHVNEAGTLAIGVRALGLGADGVPISARDATLIQVTS